MPLHIYDRAFWICFSGFLQDTGSYSFYCPCQNSLLKNVKFPCGSSGVYTTDSNSRRSRWRNRVWWNEGGEALLGSKHKLKERLGRNKKIVVVGNWELKELERVLLMVWKLMLILISDRIFIFFLCFLESTSRAHLLVSGVFRVVTTSSLTLPFHCAVEIVTM